METAAGTESSPPAHTEATLPRPRSWVGRAHSAPGQFSVPLTIKVPQSGVGAIDPVGASKAQEAELEMEGDSQRDGADAGLGQEEESVTFSC